jgi:hypothetical protein
MLSLEVRKRTGGAEVHRVNSPALTVGASSGNEVVVRARGVAGRHFRILERDGRYHLDLYKGVDAVSVNGREFTGGPIAVGDRITIGEATLTVLGGRAGLRTAVLPEPARPEPVRFEPQVAPGTLLQVTTGPMTEVEYRTLRLSTYALCRSSRSPEDFAARLVDLLDRELPPSEWAVGQWTPGGGFRPWSSTFREAPALPQKLLADAREGERLARVDTVTGMFSFLTEPDVEPGDPAAAIFVREDPRLAARALLFLEEVVQLAGLVLRKAGGALEDEEDVLVAEPAVSTAEPAAPPSGSEMEATLRRTDDLKKIIESVEREVIDRTMRRVEGNQSRGAQNLNISRGSLIAKLKDYGIPDYRYLRRERNRRV